MCKRDEFLYRQKTYDIKKASFGTHKTYIYRLHSHSQIPLASPGFCPGRSLASLLRAHRLLPLHPPQSKTSIKTLHTCACNPLSFNQQLKPMYMLLLTVNFYHNTLLFSCRLTWSRTAYHLVLHVPASTSTSTHIYIYIHTLSRTTVPTPAHTHIHIHTLSLSPGLHGANPPSLTSPPFSVAEARLTASRRSQAAAFSRLRLWSRSIWFDSA